MTESGELVPGWIVFATFATAQLSGLPVPYPELVPVLANQVKFAVNTLDRAPWRKANLQRVFIRDMCSSPFWLPLFPSYLGAKASSKLTDAEISSSRLCGMECGPTYCAVQLTEFVVHGV